MGCAGEDGGIGRRAGFRIQFHFGMGVQVPLLAYDGGFIWNTKSQKTTKLKRKSALQYHLKS